MENNDLNTAAEAAKEIPAAAEESFTARDVESRVAAAVKDAETRAEQSFSERLKEERETWEKEAKMSAEEREIAAAKRERERFEAERAAYERDKLEFEATRLLAEKKLPLNMAKMVTAMGRDALEENIGAVETMLAEYRAAVVKELTKGAPPKTAPAPAAKPLGQMTYTEQLEYFKANPKV